MQYLNIKKDTMKMLADLRVREHVRKFFNPESFDGTGCRGALSMGMMGMLLVELLVYTFLQQSGDLGELPYYTADILIVGISALEFFLAPLICYMGTQRRRSVMVGWSLLSLLCFLPLFFLPDPVTIADAGLCTSSPIAPFSSTGISLRTGIRLTMLIIAAVTCALGKSVMLGHGLAYLEEHEPSVNLYMHVAIMLLYRVLVYVMGSAIKGSILGTPWIQKVIVLLHFLITLVKLFRYPEVSPRVEKLRRNDGGLFSSMGRVLGNWVVVLQILAMGLLTAAWWGFGAHEVAFVQVRYNIKLEYDSSAFFAYMVKFSPLMLAVVLTGYMYTMPVLPKFDKKSAASNATRNGLRIALLYVLLTAALGCKHNGVAGLSKTYVQPACGQSCGCDRPWMEYTPVCVSEQVTTYFSPCHAGCGAADTVNNVGVFSNCTCAPGGRVTIGACSDGSCELNYIMHQAFYLIVSVLSTLSLAWQTTVVLETIDKRDVAVAVGIMSSVVSLFTFVGAHVGYQLISSFTCAFSRGSKCLLQNESFVPWVGYTSAVLVVLSFALGAVAYILLRREKEEKDEDLEPL